MEEFKTLLDKMFSDDLQDLVLLQHLTRKIKRKILGINNSLDEAKPLGNEFFAIIGDEDTTNVEFDVVLLLLGLEEIEWSSFGDKKDRAELQLSFNREVFDG